MDSRKAAAVFAVAVMALTAFAVMPESDAYDGSDVMEMSVDIFGPFERSVEKVYYYHGDESERYDRFMTYEVHDDLFQRYIDGESDEFLSKVVKNPVVGEMYYVYCVGTFNYYGDSKEFDRVAPTKVALKPGTIDICLMSDVPWIKAGIGGGGKELVYGTEMEIDAGLYGGSLVLHTEATDFKHLQKVKVRFSDPSVIPERHSPTEKVVMNTGLSWYHADLSLSAGHCFDDLYMFQKGSPEEDRFVAEVIDGKKSDFQRSDYGILEEGEFPAGEYSVYRTVQDPDWGWNGTVNTGFGDAGSHEMPVFRTWADPYTLFSKAYTDLTVCLDYDESRFTAHVDVGYAEYELNSGYRYVIESSYASEVKIYLINLDEGSAVCSGEVMIETAGMNTETGSPVGLAAVCIALAALVFAALFLFNRRPHW